ncbi:MAG: ADP-ribose pyrophosphatase [Actinomycetales bacterium]|nr:MAG: ADP-ribose pyrophosphatase [Actinomycetales bacterium]
MAIPEFIRDLREHIGTAELWLSSITAVVVRRLDERDVVLLVRRADNGAWSPVTGIIDPGEDPATTAVRECAEEAGVDIEVNRLCWVSATGLVVHVNGDRVRYLDHTMHCRWVAGEPRAADDENTEARWWPLDDLPEMPELFRARIDAALTDDPTCRIGPAH